MKKKAPIRRALKTASLLRIFIGESDKWGGRPLYQAIVDAARAEGLAGASVFKGFLGYGRNSELHTANLLRLSEDLPIVVEIVDESPKLERFLRHVDRMMQDGLVTIEKARVLLHRARHSMR